MYSRSKDRPNEIPRLPKHYSGCAFSQPYKVPATPIPTPPPTKSATPLYPQAQDACPQEPCQTPIEPRREPPCTEVTPLPPAADCPPPPPLREKLPASLGGLFGNLGLSFPFSHGIGFDELLIIGLMILLSHSEQESDILLFLGLLLFCG